MATVRLRAPLRELAGGTANHELDGSTVRDLIRGLESAYPSISGWILDETGTVRRHVNVFVNGVASDADAAIAPTDRVYVIPSITGGQQP